MAQAAEHLPSKCEDLSSNPRTKKKEEEAKYHMLSLICGT
jgi:hypothetical protein